MTTNKDPQQQPNNQLPNYMPPWLAALQQRPMPNAPGQMAGLARDLAAGGFGSQKANLSWLNSVFTPSQTMRPRAPTAPVTPPVKPVMPGQPVTPAGYQIPSYYQRGGNR